MSAVLRLAAPIPSGYPHHRANRWTGYVAAIKAWRSRIASDPLLYGPMMIRAIRGTPGAPVQAVGYRRVSTLEQAESGAGLDAQLATLTAEASRRGWQLEVVTDAGWSAKNLDRPALADALIRLDAGEADVLVVAKLDRLSRSTLDFCTLLERASRRGWSVVCLDLGVDTSTPTGELLSSIVAATAAYERRLIGLRTREGMAAKRAAGVHTGRRSTLPAAVRERIRAARASGQSYARIAESLDADGIATGQGGTRWYPATVRAVLLSQAATQSPAAA
jgi:DNA invertase Pin-like site-specific DNA recombinase